LECFAEELGMDPLIGDFSFSLFFFVFVVDFLSRAGVMRALCDVIGTLTASKNNFFQVHGRELANNVLNYLHNFPPEGMLPFLSSSLTSRPL
jgi:hypothetical protein